MKINRDILDRAILAFVSSYPRAVNTKPIPAVPTGKDKDLFFYQVAVDINNKRILIDLYLIDSDKKTCVVTLREFSRKNFTIDLTGSLAWFDGEQFIFVEDPKECSLYCPGIQQKLIEAIADAEKS